MSVEQIRKYNISPSASRYASKEATFDPISTSLSKFKIRPNFTRSEKKNEHIEIYFAE